MAMLFEHDTFISPFTWRYGSLEMRQIWSEIHKRQLMRKVWFALATAQHNAGLVSADQLADLKRQVDQVDVDRAQTIERETQHDVMAELLTFAEACPVGGGIIHLGATSADITDNVDVLRIREAAQLVEKRLRLLLKSFADQILATAHIPVMAYTHIQPAEPTTLGYRLSSYAQDLLADIKEVHSLITDIRGKGFKGAVGTQATFQELLAGKDLSPADIEAQAMAVLDLPYFLISTQTYTRRQDLRVVNVLASIASTLHKFGLDFRLMQSPAIGEWSEPFRQRQVGSSAMPFKRNPILTENICSMARYIASLPAIAWGNASQTVLERTLDDSANRRLFLPEAFLALDEMLMKATKVMEGMELDEGSMARNLATYGPFSASERVLSALVVAGADRQEAHEWIRQASQLARDAIREGRDNPMENLLAADERIKAFLTPAEIRELMDVSTYTGTAGERAATFAQTILQEIS
jgi:adenylosuccinate lyase